MLLRENTPGPAKAEVGSWAGDEGFSESRQQGCCTGKNKAFILWPYYHLGYPKEKV